MSNAKSLLQTLLATDTPVYASEPRSFARITPMQRVAATLQDNIKLLNDSSFTVSTPHGQKPPVMCFDKLDSKTANVFIKYLSKRVVLSNDNNRAITGIKVSVSDPSQLTSAIEARLQLLIKVVNAGELDEPLQQMFVEKRAKLAAAKQH